VATAEISYSGLDALLTPGHQETLCALGAILLEQEAARVWPSRGKCSFSPAPTRRVSADKEWIATYELTRRKP
jgi:hypothetical protein